MDTASRKPWRSFWFWLGLAAVALLAAFIFFSPTFKDWVEDLSGWAEGIMRAHSVAGGVVFFLLSAISAMLAFASSAVLVPPASEVWGKPVTFVLLWGGWVAGAIAAYAIGHFARPLLLRVVEKKKLEGYQELVSKRMKFWAALLFCLAIPSEIPGYVLGGLHYSFWKFLAAISIAEATYALGIVVAGESLLDSKPGALVAIVGIMVGVAVGAGMLLRARRGRTTSRE
ncbi:MAG: hypothetical protein M3R58_12535 [Pseudomonadota bacterium]|nr:hypothetical protein [Pseudomonadota bacterium]